MGVGKSTVGPLVAERLGLPFVDLDREIERAANATVAALFARDGEPGFRVLETRALEAVVAGPPAVLALGGGTLHARPENRALLRGVPVVWLQVSWPLLEARLKGGTSRPLLGRAKELYELRRPELAQPDHVVDGDGSPEVVAARVVALLQGT
jgi:shikimate kinase